MNGTTKTAAVPQVLLTEVARKISANYRLFPPELFGGRLFFRVPNVDTNVDDYWTIVLEEDGPHLFNGANALPDQDTSPFLMINGDPEQLVALFTGAIDADQAEDEDVSISGNSEELYVAIGDCL